MFTDLLRTALKKRNLRMADVAKRMGFHKASVSRWNKKVVPAEHLRAFREVIGIPSHELRPDIFDPPPVKAGKPR